MCVGDKHQKRWVMIGPEEGDSKDTETEGSEGSEIIDNKINKTPELNMPGEGSKSGDFGEKEKWFGYGRNVPIPLIEEYSDFGCWKKCVLAWSKTTSIPEPQQGFFLASEIPMSSKRYGSQLREDIYKHIEPDKLVDDIDGVNKIIQFLEERFYVDPEEEIYSTHRKLKYMQRKKGQTLSDYILEFDKILQKVFQLKILPENDTRLDRLFALELMLTSDLTSTEHMIIIAAANVTTDTMLATSTQCIYLQHQQQYHQQQTWSQEPILTISHPSSKESSSHSIKSRGFLITSTMRIFPQQYSVFNLVDKE